MNRKDRRADAARLRKLRAKDPNSRQVQALLAEFQAVQEALQRANTYLEYAQRAGAAASTIPVIDPGPDHEAIEGDPNWERNKLIAEAEAKTNAGRANLAAAFLDACEVLERFNEPASDIQVVSSLPSANLRP